MKDTPSVSSSNQLITFNNKKNTHDDQSMDRPATSMEKLEMKTSLQTKKTFTSLPSNDSADSSSFRGPFGITKAWSIVWYLCICILFIIAFLSLVVAVVYFINDSSTERILEIFGVCGSSALAILTFVIVFIDCFYDGSAQDYEEVTIYKIYQRNEAKEKPRLLAKQYRLSQKGSSRHQTHHHPHHLHVHPFTAYHHRFACPVCHDLHASRNSRQQLVDIAIDTSDKFEPVSKKTDAIHKSTRDAQTDPKLWDSERGTQTDRTEGTQTTAMESAGLPPNVTEIIYETTVVKAPRSLMSTVKKSLAQQDEDMVVTRIEEDSTC